MTSDIPEVKTFHVSTRVDTVQVLRDESLVQLQVEVDVYVDVYKQLVGMVEPYFDIKGDRHE